MSAAGYMLENPCIRGYHIRGDNASGADYQQERPTARTVSRRKNSPVDAAAGILRGHTPATSIRRSRRRYGPSPMAT